MYLCLSVLAQPTLPNSFLASAVRFDTFIVTTHNHVRGSTRKLMKKDHELMVEAIMYVFCLIHDTFISLFHVEVRLSIIPHTHQVEFDASAYERSGRLECGHGLCCATE